MDATTLADTVVARWQRRLSRLSAGDRSHWRTKATYYRAVAELVALRPGQPPSWRSILAAASPRGCRSTFYEVTGPHAKHPLIGELIRDGRVESMQLALCYRRSGAVPQLLDEAKVWSYWPYREQLLARHRAAPMSETAAVTALTDVLWSWAQHNPGLAMALDHAPPICAVEDLMVTLPGRYSAVSAACVLVRHIVSGTRNAKPRDHAMVAGPAVSDTRVRTARRCAVREQW